MQIDWLTVAAQIVNFLVLIWLLQRFLYRPITRAMTRREALIEERLADARVTRTDAENEAQAWRNKQQELEDRREEILEEVRREAEGLRELMEREIRDEMERKRKSWAERLDEERTALEQALRKRMVQHVLQVVRRILTDFADVDLSGQLVTQFTHRLEALGEEERQRLKDTAARTHDPILIESGVELVAPVRARATRAIHKLIADGIEVDFRTVGDVLMGLRVTIGDQTVEWSAGEYLDQLETLVAEALEMAGHGPVGRGTAHA